MIAGPFFSALETSVRQLQVRLQFTRPAGTGHGNLRSTDSKHSCHSPPQKEASMPQAKPTPGKTLLSPADHTLIMIDHQSQMAFATKSIDTVLLRNNAALVAKAAQEFKVSTILTTVAEKTFSGPIFEEIRSVFPKAEVIDRTTMNTWEDARIAKRVNEIGKGRLVLLDSGPVCASWAPRSPRLIRASRCTSSPMPAAMFPKRRMTVRWIVWCRPARDR